MTAAPSADRPAPSTPAPSLMTPGRWIEVARIVLVGVVVLLYRLGAAPLPVLLAGVAIGLYPLAKTGVLDLLRER